MHLYQSFASLKRKKKVNRLPILNNEEGIYRITGSLSYIQPPFHKPSIMNEIKNNAMNRWLQRIEPNKCISRANK